MAPYANPSTALFTPRRAAYRAPPAPARPLKGAVAPNGAQGECGSWGRDAGSATSPAAGSFFPCPSITRAHLAPDRMSRRPPLSSRLRVMSMRTLLLACLVPWLTGCCSPGHRPEFCLTASPPASPAGVVFVANGSGDFRTVSANLGRVVADTSAPLEGVTVLWSHGLGRYVIDHVHHANHLDRGARLAAEVAAYRRAYPGRKVCLVGHSTGCAVVLAAAERLPANAVDRIVLLAPSVRVSYDLRPALRTARGGIDVFYSCEDRVVLGLCMRLVGTADRRG